MDFIQFLKKNNNTRKIFGKSELLILEKQLRGIRLTQSEKNRLSRDIRAKLDFIQEAGQYSKEFKLKKGSKIWERVEEIKEIILEDSFFPRIKKIIVFGSSIKNQVTFRSDIDIAVEFDNITPEEAIKFRLRILNNFSDKIDIQAYNVLPDKIKKDIDEEGRVIYKRK